MTETPVQKSSDTEVEQLSKVSKKFNKKVTWSCNLTSVRILTPEVDTFKTFKLFPIQEDNEEMVLRSLNLI